MVGICLKKIKNKKGDNKMEKKGFTEKLADWYKDEEENNYVPDDKLVCPRCGKKLKYTNYAEKFKLSARILRERSKEWECCNCGLYFRENT